MEAAWREAKEKQEKKKEKKALSSFRARYYNDLAAFVLECIEWGEGEGPTSYQNEILDKISNSQRVSVRGPHGLGKTAMMAWIVLWFTLTRDGQSGRDWKVVTTASAWRQLSKYLWPEVHKWARRVKWAKIGRPGFSRDEIFDLKIKGETGEAFAVASDNPALIEGAHAEDILYIFDESKSVLPATFDAAEGALSTPGAKAVAMSTPGEPQGRFYDIQSRKPGYTDWWVRHVKKDEVIAAGRMSLEWAKKRREQWGEESAVYQNRVAGEFASADEDSIISLAAIERANDRWRDLQESGHWGDFVILGVDIARGGTNKTVIAFRYAAGIKELRRKSKQDTMKTASDIEVIMKEVDGPAIIDVIGVGAGVYDFLYFTEQLDARAFTASAGTTFQDKTGSFKFANVRAAAWWNLREILEDPECTEALPPDDQLTGDLTAPKWRVMAGSRIRVESKEDVVKRLGRSTDDGDAVVMAYWKGLEVTEYGENPLAGYRG